MVEGVGTHLRFFGFSERPLACSEDRHINRLATRTVHLFHQGIHVGNVETRSNSQRILWRHTPRRGEVVSPQSIVQREFRAAKTSIRRVGNQGGKRSRGW